MNETDFTDAFLWGVPGDVAARARADRPAFRLVRKGGALPNAARAFAVPSIPQNARVLLRGGRAVAQVWEDDDATWLFAAGVEPPDLSRPRAEQAEAIFPELEGVLAEGGLSFDDVVRTWFYVDEICSWYGDFNAARSRFFEKRGVFDRFLPASTGIGSANLGGAALVAGAIAMRPKHAGARAEIVESPLQAPAMAYKSSFSRAAEIITPAARTLFVSGTASIEPDSADVAHVGDPAAQIALTMRVVRAILQSRGMDWKDVSRAIVYLKEPSFAVPWRLWLEENGLPADFAAETVCDVCRDEWLFEIECDARLSIRA